MTSLPLTLLCALLAASVWHDVRARRIPNAVVFPGMLAALVLHALLPAALGGVGVWSALGGLAIGLAVLMPMYALRVMGAGDVKLLAVAAWQGSLRRLLGNTRQMMVHTGMSALAGFMAPSVAPAAPASGRLPYAVAIATGTGACLLWLHLVGEWPL